jgi:hypothetical protein
MVEPSTGTADPQAMQTVLCFAASVEETQMAFLLNSFEKLSRDDGVPRPEEFITLCPFASSVP